VLTLVPIAVAYHLSHYFSLLLTAGQFVIPLASDPFGFGWNLFGTAGSGLLNPLRIFQRSYGTLVNVTPQVQRRIGNIYMESYERELAFFAAVVSGKEKPPPLTEQRTLARTLDAVRLSAREGREVPVGEADAPAPGA